MQRANHESTLHSKVSDIPNCNQRVCCLDKSINDSPSAHLISVRSPSDSLTLLRDDLGVPGRRGEGDNMERSGRLL